MSPAVQQQFDTRKLHLITIGFILAAFVIYWFSTYSDTYGERDPYRVMVGMLDAFATGKSLASEYVYGYSISSGYFFLVEQMRGTTLTPDEMARILNLITFVSVAISLVAVYGIGTIFAGPLAGLFSVTALATMPLWYYVGQYAHPMWPGIALFLVATVMIASADRLRGAAQLALVIASILVFALGFTMRLDVILACPMLLALCLKDNRLSLWRTLRMGLIGIISLGLGLIMIKSLPAVPPDPTNSPFDLVLGWHNPTRFVQYFFFAQLRYARSLNIVLIATALLVIRFLWRDKAYPILWLTLPTLVMNYIFWIPNAQPERHFLYMVPALALLAGCGTAHLVETGSQALKARTIPIAAALAFLSALSLALALLFGTSRFLYVVSLILFVLALLPYLNVIGEKRAMTAAAAICAVAVVVFAVMPGKIIFLNPFQRDEPRYFNRVGDALEQLPPLDKPLLVISDGLPITSSMIGKDPKIKLSITVPWIYLDTGKNKFELFIQGWIAESVAEELPKRLQLPNAGVLIDPQIKADLLPAIGGIVKGHEFNLPNGVPAGANPPSK